MAQQTVSDHIQQDRAVVVLQQLHLALVGVDDSQGVPAVDTLGVHLVGGDTGADTGQQVIGHGLTAGLAAHAVGVVEDVEDDRQTALHALFPQSLQLVHGGKVEGFPNGAAAQGGITDVADHNALFLVDLLIEGRTGGDGAAAADDGVVGVHAEGQEEGVHGTAHTMMETGLAGENLSQGAVQHKADGQLLDVVALAELLHGPQGLAAQEVLHDVHKLLVAHLLDAAEALGQNLGVASVGSEDIVILIQQIGLTDAGCFLAQGQVGRAGIGGVDAVVAGLSLDQVQHVLELAENGDIAVDADQIRIGEVGALLGDGLVVGANRNVLKVDFARCSGGYRIDIQRLGHGNYDPFYYGIYSDGFHYQVTA